MEKLLALSFLFTVVLTIPGFLCAVILLIIAKEWKWLALTVGNLLFFLFPELLLAFLIIPAMIESFSAWIWVGFLFLPCIQPAWMLVKGRKTGNGLLFSAAIAAIAANLGYLSFAAMCVFAIARARDRKMKRRGTVSMMRYCKLLLISMMLFTLTGCGCCCGCSLPLIAGGLLLLSCILLPIQKFLMNRITSHPDFYTYEGFRDFYRFPLVYPYHITMIDTYGRGWLEEYIGGDIENSSESSNSILSDISAIIREDDRLIFKLEKPDREGNLYGIFDYRSGEVLRFKDADSLRSELGMKDPLQFDSLEKAYDDYWHPAKKAKKK